MGGNIVIVLIDDLGVDRVGLYGASDVASTPNLDALAAEGVTFQTAYAAATCSPARASLLTGRYPSRHGIGGIVDVNHDPRGLADAEVTLPELVQPAGYVSSMVGKWHLDPNAVDDFGLRPVLQGFDWYRGALSNLSDYYDWPYYIDGEPTPDSRYLLTAEVDDAVDRVGAMPEPWLLYVALHSIHTPYHEPPEELHSQTLVPGDMIAVGHAMVEAVDIELGRLLAALPDDTTVVVLGDNGTAQEYIGEPFDAMRSKGSMFEGGLRVPFIVSAPWIATPGTTSTEMVHVVDVFPTVAEIAGVPSGTVDGLSLVTHLRDGTPTGREVLFAERFSPNFEPETNTSVVRDHAYKLIRADETDTFYAFGPDGLDEGADLLAGGLDTEQQLAYDRLVSELEAIRADLD